MKIKWCKEIFEKDNTCLWCDVAYDYNFFKNDKLKKQCYGIFYIFYKIGRLRFLLPVIFKAIIEKIKSLKHDDDDDNDNDDYGDGILF